MTMTETQALAAFSTAGEDLPNMLKVMATFASTDSTRPALTGVLFECEGGELRLTATDSYVLATLDTGVKCDEFAPFLVTASDLASVVKITGAVKHTGRNVYAVVRVGAGERYRDGVTFKGAGDLTVSTLEADYPNYRQLMPAIADCVPQSVTLTPKYVERMAKAVRTLGGGSWALLRYVGGTRELGPQVFKSTDGLLTMLIMPVRVPS